MDIGSSYELLRSAGPAIAVHHCNTGGAEVPLLLVHGATSGAWHFLERWAPVLAEDGHPVFALDLRGHGASEGREALRGTTLTEFAADAIAAVDHVATRTGRAPVLVGHSMGAVIGRLVAARRDVAGLAVLGFGDVALSFAAFGSWAMRRFPWATFTGLVRGDLGGLFAATGPQHQLMFAADPLDEVHDYVERFRNQPESAQVFTDLRTLSAIPAPRTDRILLAAGQHDPLVPHRALECLAEELGTAAIRVPGAAHDLFVGRAWRRALGVVQDWLCPMHTEMSR